VIDAGGSCHFEATYIGQGHITSQNCSHPPMKLEDMTMSDEPTMKAVRSTARLSDLRDTYAHIKIIFTAHLS